MVFSRPRARASARGPGYLAPGLGTLPRAPGTSPGPLAQARSGVGARGVRGPGGLGTPGPGGASARALPGPGFSGAPELPGLWGPEARVLGVGARGRGPRPPKWDPQWRGPQHRAAKPELLPPSFAQQIRNIGRPIRKIVLVIRKIGQPIRKLVRHTQKKIRKHWRCM